LRLFLDVRTWPRAIHQAPKSQQVTKKGFLSQHNELLNFTNLTKAKKYLLLNFLICEVLSSVLIDKDEINTFHAIKEL
jgi:hypothetical protein